MQWILAGARNKKQNNREKEKTTKKSSELELWGRDLWRLSAASIPGWWYLIERQNEEGIKGEWWQKNSKDCGGEEVEEEEGNRWMALFIRVYTRNVGCEGICGGYLCATLVTLYACSGNDLSLRYGEGAPIAHRPAQDIWPDIAHKSYDRRLL